MIALVPKCTGAATTTGNPIRAIENPMRVSAKLAMGAVLGTGTHWSDAG